MPSLDSAGQHHRLMCRCPVCGAVMSAGRLQQHVKTHKEAA